MYNGAKKLGAKILRDFDGMTVTDRKRTKASIKNRKNVKQKRGANVPPKLNQEWINANNFMHTEKKECER